MTGALLLLGAVGAEAHYTPTRDSRIGVQKDEYMTSYGDVDFAHNVDADIADLRVARDWYRFSGAAGRRLDHVEVQTAAIESDLDQPGTMISPDSAKVSALCAVPGHIGSSDMEVNDAGRTEYEIDIVPTGKRTWTKVVVDARTGAVLSTKQFGGLRG